MNRKNISQWVQELRRDVRCTVAGVALRVLGQALETPAIIEVDFRFDEPTVRLVEDFKEE
jgi:hypothetical protein